MMTRMQQHVPKDKALTILRKLILRGEGLPASSTSDPDGKRWRNDTNAAVRNIFGSDSPQYSAIQAVRFSPVAFSLSGDDDDNWRRAFKSGVDSTQQHLASMISEIEDFWPDPAESHAQPLTNTPPIDGPVFIVHGHKLDLAQSVARFVERLGLPTVILHEEADRGRTIIEKFEEEAASCSFALVLATGDDEARKLGADSDLYPRARQNVVLELGYFLGKLGRSRVALLYEPDVELPSDYAGVLYLELSGEWRVQVAREMRAAGLSINTDAVL